MSQPLRMAWIGKACEMKRVLVGRAGDDGIDFATQCQPHRRFDRVAGDPSGADETVVVPVRVAGAEPPRSDGYFPPRGYCGDLIFRTHQGDLGFERLNQRAGGDLRPDAARIAQRYRQPRPSVRT